MTNKIEYATKEDHPGAKLQDIIGTGIVNARSAAYLIKRCRFTGKDELNAAIAAAWAHKNPILQYRGKYFRPANAEELAKYMSRQSDADGNPVIEYK